MSALLVLAGKAAVLVGLTIVGVLICEGVQAIGGRIEDEVERAEDVEP